MSVSKKSVLITGGAGFIGSHLAGKLLNLGYKVVVLDNFQTGHRENLPQSPDLELVEGDVNSAHDIRDLIKIPLDYIYHYAASVGVKRTLARRLEVLDDIEGIKNILNLAREKKIKRIFYSSSSEVYGESVSFPQDERSTPINSRLPYAAVKNLGEIFIHTYHLEYGIAYTIFRFFNTYGPRQSKEFVMSKFIDQALSGQDITLYGDGSQTRSFMYIGDNVEATTRALSSSKVLNETINIGNPLEITIKELAETIIRVSGSQSRLVHLPALVEGDMTRRVPDISRMKSLLDYVPQTTLEAGIKRTISALANPQNVSSR
jgi:UDP-glucuronate decarboxylase